MPSYSIVPVTGFTPNEGGWTTVGDVVSYTHDGATVAIQG